MEKTGQQLCHPGVPLCALAREPIEKVVIDLDAKPKTLAQQEHVLYPAPPLVHQPQHICVEELDARLQLGKAGVRERLNLSLSGSP